MGVSDAQSTPRATGKGPKGKGKPPGATSGAGETRRTPYEAKETRVQDLGTPAGRTLARGARAQHTADDTDTAANSAVAEPLQGATSTDTDMHGGGSSAIAGRSIEAFRSHARLMVQPTAVLPRF